MGRAYQNRKESMAKTADAKTKVYSKYGREIYVAAKSGGVDPTANLTLRGLIERAKKDQVPTHVIDKALEKASGAGGEDFSVARYEGFGPAGSMLIVDCLTDNPNRTFGDVRQCFTKTKSKIGTPGNVSHLFDHCAILKLKAEDEEAVLEVLLNADVDVMDIENENGHITVFAPNTDYGLARQALCDNFGDDNDEIDFETDIIQFLPQVALSLEGEDVEVFDRLLDLLNDLDDVQDVYHNVEA
ncbi:MAG: YebC/PmpR family DNA-binding transcriptional regulator [Gammaproteobacteria bacterium]|jgi:YebC/PmpR family DNA-binding regulatory protein|nr:YebC/PmpR family DNA-binding transcriptional regulator [Gammaproteobacteria bacterium]MBT3860991.1 YebC/PmpR family DNA-binding transcriptional regulator [Gammaproteobacteria bacterium]MBT3986252.1 YebC/PmpR family DNA-binding transcriptional regulator [Gammaproteobacteria bacterium]MBT4256071.1 YebC/PmpR family DNA-binding transcriptional regulator [Gammaproteobacteria bacterium]MBT4582674.1 YebC/PmpR family DNA-binding transcriptional regulator [Gammaproteobacteria bacterium]